MSFFQNTQINLWKAMTDYYKTKTEYVKKKMATMKMATDACTQTESDFSFVAYMDDATVIIDNC